MHVLYYLATLPEYMQPLREEVEEVVKSEGWTKAGLDKMHKIDSFIRESQRLHPVAIRKWWPPSPSQISELKISLVALARVALKDFTFSDGTTIPRGTTVCIPRSVAHFNDKVYEDPSKFDGFRFSKMLERSTKKKVGIVSSNQDHLPFGLGRHICPGRYFAACELKLMLAHTVVTYDVKLEIEGVRPEDMWFMDTSVPNPNANVLFRKRANM